MKSFIYFVLVSLVLSCGRNPAIKDDYTKLVDAEIARRLELIKSDSSVSTTSINGIHKEVQNLILLSKDAENSANVLFTINNYFKEVTHKHDVPYDGFVPLVKTMNLQTIEATIKTNELNLLDKIIFMQTTLTNDSAIMNSVY